MFDNRQTAEEHKVRTGDSLASLAKQNKLTSQELAEFNWGTCLPEQVNDHLYDDVGCTKRDPAGNYIFDDTDDPGIVLIPQRFKRDGFAARMVHTITVRQPQHDPCVIDCVALPGATFKFSRSFIRPGVTPQIERIFEAVDEFVLQQRDVRLCVFGHTDSADDPRDNKRLSERRAWALWAVLVHDPLVWVQLADHAAEQWDEREFRRVRNAIGQTGEKKPGRAEYDQYLQILRNGREPLPESRFLKQGGIAGFMGCSEFNPLKLNVRPHSDPANQLANEPNRRVMVFMFDGRKLPKLPCQYNNIAPCRQQGAREGTNDLPLQVFSCAAYDRIARECDCEYGNILNPDQLFDVHFQVKDVAGNPMADEDYRVTLSDESTRTGKTDAQGYVTEIDVPPGDVLLELGNYSHLDVDLTKGPASEPPAGEPAPEPDEGQEPICGL